MDPVITIFSLLALLFSVIIHELAHGYVAYSLGDKTAKYAGRLTLNPIKHLDLFGSILIPLFLFLLRSPVLFGWAKPVPVNQYNFTDQKYGNLKVSAAGPLSTLSLALIFGIILRFLPDFLLVLHPGIALALTYIVMINLWLCAFNLIPIPPLDGSWILFHFLGKRAGQVESFLRQNGFLILLFLIFFGGLDWLSYIVVTIFTLITGMPLTF